MLTTEQVRKLLHGTRVRKRGTTKIVQVAYTCNYGTAIYYYSDCNCAKECHCKNSGKNNKRKICREQLEVVGKALSFDHCLKPGDWVKDLKQGKWFRFICVEGFHVWVEEYNGRFFTDRRNALMQQERIATIQHYDLSGNVATRIPADQVKCLQVGDVIRSICGERYLVASNEIQTNLVLQAKDHRLLVARKILQGKCYGGMEVFRDSDGYTPIEEEGVNIVMATPKFKKGDSVVFVKDKSKHRRTCKIKTGDILTIEEVDARGCDSVHNYSVEGHNDWFYESELEIQKLTTGVLDLNIKKLEAELEEVEKKLQAEKDLFNHLKSSGQEEITPLELKCYMALEAFDGKASKFEKARAIANLFEDLR